jgi:hypothetical protein
MGSPRRSRLVEFRPFRVRGEWCAEAVAIDWAAGSAIGVLFRAADDMLDVMRGGPGR